MTCEHRWGNPLECHDCGRSGCALCSVLHPDNYYICLNCYWDEMNRRLEPILANDIRFVRLNFSRGDISLYIVERIGRHRSLLWEPKEILKAYSKNVRGIEISRPPENKYAKVGKVVWVCQD